MEPPTLLERFYLNNCRKIFDKYLELNVDLFDVTLMGDDGTCVKCHRFVLSACSPFFERAFENCKRPRDGSDVDKTEFVMLLASYKSENVRRMVDYIYYGKLPDQLSNEVDNDTDENFIRLANDLKIIGLAELLFERKQNSNSNDQAPETIESDEKVSNCNGNVSDSGVETSDSSHEISKTEEDIVPEPVTKWMRRLSNIQKTIAEKKQTLQDINFGDIIERLILDKYKSLMSNDQHSAYKVIAGIVKSVDNDPNNLKVVSIGTGSKFFYGKNLDSNGNVVHDTHAEVVARRGFIRYVYNQINQHVTSNSSSSIFEKTDDLKSKFQLKSGIKFHLYVSTAPCGDVRVHSHKNGKDSISGAIPEGQLRTKGQSALTVTKDTTAENISKTNMSCSAKLLKWNILGIQGALLTELIEPIYFSSIILGEKFNAKHMERALYGRIETDSITLPKGFSITQPELMKVSMTKAKVAPYSPNHSINWNGQGYNVEIIESTSGKTMGRDKTKKYSRISKRAFFCEFQRICKKLNRKHELKYSDAKSCAHDYQVAKSTLFQIFENNGLGSWVQKRRNVNDFTI